MPFMQPYLDRGWEVYGITPPGPRIRALERAGVRWLPHRVERRISLRTDIMGSRGLYQQFREHRFDIVHAHNAKTGILARLVAAAARVPVIVHTHHGLIYSMQTPAVRRAGAAALERVASEVSDRIFVQSEDDYRTLRSTGGAPDRVLELVGNGIDLERFDSGRFDASERARLRRALGVAENDVLFFSAGRLVNEKGFNELFEAHARATARDKRIRLAVAGPEDHERGLGIAGQTLDRARRAGALLLGERSDMPVLYAASDVVVLASWREGIARVLMEGAAMGKPLLASDARGCGLVVRPGWGFIVPTKNAAALSDRMLELAADARLRAEIGAHNARAARELYDLKRVLGRIEASYLELLGNKGIEASGPGTHAAPGISRVEQ